MQYLKLLGIVCAGFALPVLLAIKTGPKVFPGAFTPAVAPRPLITSSPIADDHPAIETSGAFQTVSSDAALDPIPGRYFVVSFQVKLNGLPRVGKRQRLIAKYAPAGSPYPGWAIAIRRLKTSTRPEVYWQNSEGKGGWYTFEKMRFEKHHWYSVTLVGKDSDLLSLYIEELGSDGVEALPEETTDEAAIDTNTVSATGVRFLGGYNLGDMKIVPTNAPLQFAPRSSQAGDFRGELKHVLIARPERLPPKQAKLMEFVTGGAAEIADRVEPDEISLWIDEEGSDRSAARRPVSLVTNPS